MIRRKPNQTPKPNPLPQQESDFTAEGSPPPVQSAEVSPVPQITQKKPGSLPSAPIARKGPAPHKSRWQR